MKKAIFFIFLACIFYSQPAWALETGLVFSEIMHDYPGADQGHEWVEIFNSGGPTVAVLGSSNQAWRFFDGAKHILSLAQGTTTIAAEQYFILAGDGQQFLLDYPGYTGTVFDTVMSLPNTSANLGLSFDGGTTMSATVSYDSAWGAAGNSFSLEKINLNQGDVARNWQESTVAGGTPGLINSVRPSGPTLLPQAVASCPGSLLVNEVGRFDASASTEPNNLALSYLWDFGDNITATTSIAEHAYNNIGNYTVSLKVNNGQAEASATCLLEVVADAVPPEDAPPSPGSGGGQNSTNNSWFLVKISEFMPNPPGKDDGEWIELFNSAGNDMDLSGFALQDNSTKIFSIENIVLAAQGYGLFYKNETGLSLNNTGGDAVKLYDPQGALLEVISYKDTAPEGKSWSRQNNDFSWSSNPTPGKENIFSVNQNPLAKIKIKSQKLSVGEKIIFSAGESSDPEEGRLSYEWDFGDDSSGDEAIENHIYRSGGIFQVQLKVSDPQGASAEASLPVSIEEGTKDISLTDVASIDFNLTDLMITEFLPDPVGSDEGEWVELYNNSPKNINLSGWQLDDAEGGSRPYVFPVSSNIMAGSFLIINRSDSKLALNNQNDAARLLTPLGDVWQQVVYEKIPEGQSQAWDFFNQEWFVSAKPSPGSANVAPSSEINSSLIEDIRNLKNNTEVWLELVALQDANPQSRSLYTIRHSGESLDYNQVVEIYFSKKQWPDIKTGDVLTASGLLSNTANGSRLKISTPDQMVLSGQNYPLEKIEQIDLNSLDDDLLSSYITTGGVIVKKSGQNIYLAGSAEEDSVLRAYLDFDYKSLDIKKGGEILVSGILQNTASGWKLLVKNKEDILLSQQVLGAKESSADTSTSSQTVLGVKRLKNTKILLLILLGVVIFVFLAYLIIIKKRRSNLLTP